MLAITKQHRFTYNYDKIITFLLHFYKKMCHTKRHLEDFCQSANKIWFIVKIKMMAHLRLNSSNTLLVLYNIAEEGPLLPKGKQLPVQISQNSVTPYDFDLCDKIFLIRTDSKHYAWTLKRVGSQIYICIIFLYFFENFCIYFF